MDTDRWEQLKDAFFGALERTEGERAVFLEAACGGDPVLCAEVEAMLAAHEAPPALPLGARAPTDADDELVGTRVGAYRLGKRLGQGGMGAVYLAERDDAQYRQRVALKLIRPGLHAAELVARFRAERQILARLQHPHIARLLDGGRMENGLPFLVMEYVEGVPLTRFCDAHRLPIPARLRLFRTVCAAVQFAHRNLVVHRDLKPSNILVAEGGRVKLLDFGIAKLLRPDAVEGVSMPHTQPGARLLTLAYAAPEQVRGGPITTATDVYALGVLLYELLTGHRPYRLPAHTAEAERVICEVAPVRPSTAVTTRATWAQPDGTLEPRTPEGVSAARAAAAGRLPRMLRGDLDTIVLRALRKEPERRYASVEQMADDLERHLEGLPIRARPDTVGYRAGKFVRRHRVGVGVAAGVLLLLLGFSAVTATQARRIARERDKAEQVAAFLGDIFAAADPAAAQGDTLTALELLDRGAARIEAELTGQATVQADLLDVMSRAYLSQGAYRRAETLARRALTLRPPPDPRAATSQLRLAIALHAQSRFDEADSLVRRVIAHHRARGHDGALVEALEQRADFLVDRMGPPDTVKAVFEEALAVRRRHFGPDDPGRGAVLHRYAGAYHVSGDYAASERLFREALAEQRRHAVDPVTTAETLYRLGAILSFRTEFHAADSLLRQSIGLHEQVYGRAHPKTAEVLVYRGITLAPLGRFDEAESLLREALATYGQDGGRPSPGYQAALRGLREVLTQAGRYDEALAVAREAADLAAARQGPDSRSYATDLAVYAQVLNRARRPGEALDVFAEALPLLEHSQGRSPFYAVMLAEAAGATAASGDAAGAEAHYEQAYAILRERVGPQSYQRSSVAYELGRRRADRGDHAGALPLLEDAAELRIGDSDLSAALAARAAHALGRTMLALGRPADAAPPLRRAYGAFRRLFGEDDAQTRAAGRDLQAAAAALASPAPERP